jgi:hypothetical protein
MERFSLGGPTSCGSWRSVLAMLPMVRAERAAHLSCPPLCQRPTRARDHRPRPRWGPRSKALVVKWGGKRAKGVLIDDLSFSLPRGGIVGVIGPAQPPTGCSNSPTTTASLLTRELLDRRCPSLHLRARRSLNSRGHAHTHSTCGARDGTVHWPDPSCVRPIGKHRLPGTSLPAARLPPWHPLTSRTRG